MIIKKSDNTFGTRFFNQEVLPSFLKVKKKGNINLTKKINFDSRVIANALAELKSAKYASIYKIIDLDIFLPKILNKKLNKKCFYDELIRYISMDIFSKIDLKLRKDQKVIHKMCKMDLENKGNILALIDLIRNYEIFRDFYSIEYTNLTSELKYHNIEKDESMTDQQIEKKNIILYKKLRKELNFPLFCKTLNLDEKEDKDLYLHLFFYTLVFEILDNKAPSLKTKKKLISYSILVSEQGNSFRPSNLIFMLKHKLAYILNDYCFYLGSDIIDALCKNNILKITLEENIKFVNVVENDKDSLINDSTDLDKKDNINN